MSKSAMKHMGNKARLAFTEDRATRINLHAFTGRKVIRSVQAAVELAPTLESLELTAKARQCEACWEELHTDHLIYRFESLRDAKRGRVSRKEVASTYKNCQMLMDWQEEEMQADAWLEIAIWDCVAENSLYL